eukprot:GEMP01065416.1.p1 GENE.GEMP01065416.1~~GEMP01065416.1.p1  ORF type:complete len:189 (+),score=40.70 GEMP01065416.1:255-821(+)
MHVVRYLGSDVNAPAEKCDKELLFEGRERLTKRLVICGANPFVNGFQGLESRLYAKREDTRAAQAASSSRACIKQQVAARVAHAARAAREARHDMLGDSLDIPTIDVDDDEEPLDMPESMRRSRSRSPRRDVQNAEPIEHVNDNSKESQPRDEDIAKLCEISRRPLDECCAALVHTNGSLAAALDFLL